MQNLASINNCRAKAFEAFSITLADLKDNPRVTEMYFRDAWLERLQQIPDLYADGWYDPPQHGISILFASEEKPERLCYDSLRNKEYWPGFTKADWNGYLFAYSSCVSRKTGLIGDFDLTLYFGNTRILKKHYRNCFEATKSLLNSIRFTDTPCEILARSEALFAKAGLKNCVTSVTDIAGYNIGHSSPALTSEMLKESPHELGSKHKNFLRTTRKFINQLDNWRIENGIQFVIEPKLQSLNEPSLPQISFHYLLKAEKGQIQICRDIDKLIEPYLD